MLSRDPLLAIKSVPNADELKSRLRAETGRLWSVIRDRYTGRNGLLNYFVDPFSGHSLRTTNAIKDFGDSLQYAAYASTLLEDTSLAGWALSQIEIASRLFQQPDGFFLSDETTEAMTPPRPSGYFKLEDNSDLLMGLVGTYRQTKAPVLVPIIQRLTGFLERLVMQGRSISNVFWLMGSLRIDLPFRLPDGLFVEELVNWAELTGETRCLEVADRMSGSWENSAYVRRHAFYPIAALAGRETNLTASLTLDAPWLDRAAPRMAERFRTSYFIKMNTNMVSGDLALYRATRSGRVRQRLIRWLEAAQNALQRPDGYFYGRWDSRTRQASHGGYPLADNHHLLNIFEDAAWILEDESYLRIAEKNAAFWLSQMTPLGFFPELYKGGFERAAVLDNQVDYLITLLKLYELTQKNIYLERVIVSTQALVTLFHADFGLKWCIHADTGENMKPAICTKFLSLFTKLTLLLHEVLAGKKLLEDSTLFDLSRDR